MMPQDLTLTTALLFQEEKYDNTTAIYGYAENLPRCSAR